MSSLPVLSRIIPRHATRLSNAMTANSLPMISHRSVISNISRCTDASNINIITTSSFSSSTSPSSSATGGGPYTLPPLPYEYSALEPAISGQIMETHHKKHHQTYVSNLNTALTQLEEAKHNNDLTKIVQLQSAINFNGGGHLNHSIFWSNLAPKQQGGGTPPTGDLLTAIEAEFGSFSSLQSALSTASIGIQGSGWGWLGYNNTTGKLQIVTKPNQDPLLGDHSPLLGIDVWEHAYYYLYGPARAEYLRNIWTVVNWSNVGERLKQAKSKSNKTK